MAMCSPPPFLPSLSSCMYVYLLQVVGFDSVDDESKVESTFLQSSTPDPSQWNSMENPPYAYYQFYMYAHITMLNKLRR